MNGLDIEGVLRDHYPHGYSCGDTCDHNLNSPAGWAGHVAAVLREQIAAAQAEAWDEGVRRACGTTRDALVAMCLRNPYRAAQFAPARVPSEEG